MPRRSLLRRQSDDLVARLTCDRYGTRLTQRCKSRCEVDEGQSGLELQVTHELRPMRLEYGRDRSRTPTGLVLRRRLLDRREERPEAVGAASSSTARWLHRRRGYVAASSETV